jgi:hypothetical protein
LWSCAAAQRSEEGDGSVATVTFFFFLQRKKQKEEGDGSKAIVAFFFLLFCYVVA